VKPEQRTQQPAPQQQANRHNQQPQQQLHSHPQTQEPRQPDRA
jgi:hypothetical protein